LKYNFSSPIISLNENAVGNNYKQMYQALNQSKESNQLKIPSVPQ